MKVTPPRPVMEAVWTLHKAAFRLSDGRVGNKLAGMPVGMLCTTGRKSGAPRETMLTYAEHEGGWAVVASNLGSDRAPAWWLNLQAGGEASYKVGRSRHAVAGREASEAEHRKLWPRFTAVLPDYDDYVKATARPIPVVVLERR